MRNRINNWLFEYEFWAAGLPYGLGVPITVVAVMLFSFGVAVLITSIFGWN